MFLEHATRFPGLLAQNDSSEWMNILFMVVLAVFWLVGGLVKAAGANRRNRQRQKKEAARSAQEMSPGPRRVSWLDRLAQKAEEIQKSIEQQTGASEQGARKPQPQADQSPPGKPAAPGTGHIAVRTDRKGGPVLVYERQTTPAARPKARQPHRRPPERPMPTPRQAKPARSLTVSEMSAQNDARRRAEFQAASEIDRPAPELQLETPLIDYSDPEVLRRAILHYEILGRPLAFRDPLDRMSPFQPIANARGD